MEDINYFKIDGLDIEYPIHILINGRRWNFKAEYEKKIKSDNIPDVNHKLFDLLVDIGYFEGLQIIKKVPFIVTDDIRIKGDKRTYYIADYLIPKLNFIIILTNKIDISMKTPRVKYMEPTLRKLGYDVLVIQDLYDNPRLSEYLVGLKSSFKFRTNPEIIIQPHYFK